VDHTASLAAARVRRFLEQEPVVWLSTVRPDGTPHIVPIWFWWDGDAVLVFSKPEAQKVRNMRVHPAVMLGVGDPEDDFDIGLLEGSAELLGLPTASVLPAAHLEKYAARMAEIGLSAEEYAATYSQVIRITPDHYLGWHGRSVPHSARVAGAPDVSIDEPATGRPGLLDWLGEPLSRGLRGLGLGAGAPRPAAAGL
jgi:PPOX class probable F420-dependent enzyme